MMYRISFYDYDDVLITNHYVEGGYFDAEKYASKTSKEFEKFVSWFVFVRVLKE